MEKLVNYFPLFALIGSVAAYFFPEYITWFSGNWIKYSLGLIMLGMGFTLKIEDFKRVLAYPVPTLIGVFLQYFIMPILGFAFGNFYGLSPALFSGLVLVACCPGGTASNIICYIARADVALSVTMTTISTFLAIIMTPLLTSYLVGSRVEVSAMKLFLDTRDMILFPVILGVLLNSVFPKFSEKVSKVSPFMAVLLVVMIVSSVIGASGSAIISSGWKLIASVFSLHAGGFLLGYILSKIFVRNEIYCRTISIEVGMQNSGMGVVLARLNFSDPLAAVPPAISSLFHSLIASALAAVWRKDTVKRNGI